MSERVWARVGQIGTAVLAICALITLVVALSASSSRLVADIRPMAFRLPVTDSQIEKIEFEDELRKTSKLISDVLIPLIRIHRVTGLVKIDLYNTGDLPISDIHIGVRNSVLYAKGTEGSDDTSILPNTDSGTTLDSLIQGGSVTVYVWTYAWPPAYRDWRSVDDLFNITFSQGVAEKHIYIEGSRISGWFDRNSFYLIPVGIVLLPILITWMIWMVTSAKNRRKPTPTGVARPDA